MPAWIGDLDVAEVTRVEVMTDTLGDGDNYLIEVRLAGGELISPIVYVDHNLGTVVKNAFVIPEGLDQVVARYDTLMDETQSIEPLDPAVARAQLTCAIHDGAAVFPPLESEDWPQCRPLVEWVVSLMPADGRLPKRPTWTNEERQKLVGTFFTSGAGRQLDAAAESREVFDLLWQFGLEVGPGDPLRWSPVNVEILLTSWLPERLAYCQTTSLRTFLTNPGRTLVRLPTMTLPLSRHHSSMCLGGNVSHAQEVHHCCREPRDAAVGARGHCARSRRCHGDLPQLHSAAHQVEARRRQGDCPRQDQRNAGHELLPQHPAVPDRHEPKQRARP